MDAPVSRAELIAAGQLVPFRPARAGEIATETDRERALLAACLNEAELAKVFRAPIGTLRARVRVWTLRNGFPPPLPRTHPKLWSRQAVETWIADPQGYAAARGVAR